MDKLLKKLMKEKHHALLALLLVTFIVVDVDVPLEIANLVDTIVGKTVVILVVLSLLTYNKFVGILGVVAGYMLVIRSMNETGNKNISYLETEKTKTKKMFEFNKKPEISIEEEVINNMLPLVSDQQTKKYNFKPVQGDLHDAEKL